ncbi:MAG: nucleotidyltransferase domain-containing protein [Bacillota bacterium]|nr:nucleotidyltransferase domain-containing protein [Bacillota bacterium]
MITRETLITEYGKMICEIRSLDEELKTLTVGSIQKKVINGKEYFYLARREGDKVVTHYIKAEKLSETEDEIFRRHNVEMTMRQLRASKALIEKSVGREFASTEHIKSGIKKVVEENPKYGVEKVTLFGSRANGKFTDKSDVDLMVKFKKDSHVGLFEMSDLRLKLIDVLGLDVDLIEESSKLLPGVQIGKVEIVYG